MNELAAAQVSVRAVYKKRVGSEVNKMIKKAALLVLLILRLPAVSYAEIDRDDPSAYGIGILTCPYASFIVGSECFRVLSWLREPVNLYEQPSDTAKIVGTILDPDEDLQGWQPFHFWDVDGAEKELDTVEIGYEEKAIVIYEQKEMWLRTGQGWLRNSDVRLDASTVFLTWDTVLGYQMHGFLEQGQHYIGWFYPIANQSLIDSPEGEVIGNFWDLLRDDNRPDLLVLNRQGNWIEVTIDNQGTTCSSQNQEPPGPTGWIQLTDNNDNPLVYWYTRGC